MSNGQKIEYIISFPQQWQNVVHPNARQWAGLLKCDGMTDVAVKILKGLLRTCAHARTQETFLRFICHIRHLSLVRGER